MRIACSVCFYFVSALMAGAVEDEEHHARIQTNEDGTKTEFRRQPYERTLIKSTYSKEGTLISKTIYRRNIYGKLSSCKIYDGRGTELFKVAYGYDPKTGRLQAENMYSSKSGKLSRILWYSYDAQGKRSQPRIVVQPEFEKVPEGLLLYLKPTAPEKDPFPEKGKEKP